MTPSIGELHFHLARKQIWGETWPGGEKKACYVHSILCLSQCLCLGILTFGYFPKMSFASERNLWNEELRVKSLSASTSSCRGGGGMWFPLSFVDQFRIPIFHFNFHLQPRFLSLFFHKNQLDLAWTKKINEVWRFFHDFLQCFAQLLNSSRTHLTGLCQSLPLGGSSDPRNIRRDSRSRCIPSEW